jgi:hypothetical protein
VPSQTKGFLPVLDGIIVSAPTFETKAHKMYRKMDYLAYTGGFRYNRSGTKAAHDGTANGQNNGTGRRL